MAVVRRYTKNENEGQHENEEADDKEERDENEEQEYNSTGTNTGITETVPAQEEVEIDDIFDVEQVGTEELYHAITNAYNMLHNKIQEG